jgi:hypothetical protein
MRRLAVLSLAPLAATVVALAGCGSAGGSSPSAAGTAIDDSPSVSAPASPSAALASHAATGNAKQVCAAINQAIAQGASTFGTDLGNIVGHLAGGNKTEADKAKTAALGHLKDTATKIRATGATADDPALRTAAQNTADAISALATDPALLGGVKSAADLKPLIEKMTRATDGMNSVCV